MIREARPGEAAALADGYEWLFAPPDLRPSRWDADAHRFYERERPDNRSVEFGWVL